MSTNELTVGRRDFLKWAGAATAGITFSQLPIMAGPFDDGDWNEIIPTDKKLRPEWVQSLFQRTTPTTYTKARNELRYIGMPVGGICCGTLYLSGDGRLWNWDIFNQKTEGILPTSLRWQDLGMDFAMTDGTVRSRDGARFVKPATPADSQKIAQGFALRITHPDGKVETRRLDSTGWADVSFTGQYPIGTIEYSDPVSPVSAKLEAFSPFIPHDADDSGIPATLFHYTVHNRGGTRLKVDLAGWLQNATSFHSAEPGDGQRINQVKSMRSGGMVTMHFVSVTHDKKPERADLPVEDFEKGYGSWKVEGDAFGTQPASRSVIPSYQGDVGGEGAKVANSHASAPGNSIEDKDARQGRLISPTFKLQRKYLSFYIGGGRRKEVGLRLLVEGAVVATVTGHNNNRMRRESIPVTEWEGRDAVIEIFDEAAGGWANVGVDHIVQTDQPKAEFPVDERTDFGTMALASVGRAFLHASLSEADLPDAAFSKTSPVPSDAVSPVGSLMQERVLEPGQTVDFKCVLAWHFPKSNLPCPDSPTGNYYAKKFSDATAVAAYVLKEWDRLATQTRLWRDTWYDSSLPHWFLDRTFGNVSTLATTTAHRFGSGRFWGWEGVGCCEGTCTHVWHYGQAMGRLFPELERDLRERVDLGVGFVPESGVIRHRAEGTGPAIDGHCGRVLGVWREHQMSSDGAFLKRLWPRVKKAAEYILEHDKDDDGILDGSQENTLDAAWYGKIAWITSLSMAALRAVEEMAREQGDDAFALRCRTQWNKAKAAVELKLFNGEYFFQVADPTRPKSLGTYEACHIDQVQGQSWAWQVGLGRVLDRDKTLSALNALWKYNFAPDVGPFRKKFTAGRPYAMAGDAGLVMTSNPKRIKDVYGISSWQIGYFNECMSGFEHQVASHMIAEGMVLEGLAVTRAIHDRYHAARRNPYNEVECSDHYARAMASYGSFISACGFECHGPSGHLGFAPRISPEKFKAAFTVAGGWGTYSQERSVGKQSHGLRLKFGRTRLNTLAVTLPENAKANGVTARRGLNLLPVAMTQDGSRVELRFANELILEANVPLLIEVSWS